MSYGSSAVTGQALNVGTRRAPTAGLAPRAATASRSVPAATAIVRSPGTLPLLVAAGADLAGRVYRHATYDCSEPFAAANGS
jgi:hypothetical protein